MNREGQAEEGGGGCPPRISVVTPSLNQAPFIEQTLRSVLDQNYPNLEYIVIDGGSTDGTVDILRRYESRVEHWISEPDLGQADAINKGLAMATGEICSFLNSDDLYEPGSLARVAFDFGQGDGREWHAYPVQDFTGDRLLNVHEAPGLSRKLGNVPLEHRGDIANDLLLWVIGRVRLHQPGVFWRRKHWLEVGGLESRYHYAFDRQFFMKLVSAGYPLITHRGPPVARFRLHDGSKTVQNLIGVDNVFARERMAIADEFESWLMKEERKISRSVRAEDTISAAWRMFREGVPRVSCFAWLARLALSKREALQSRYFWGSVLRFLFVSRQSGS